MFGLIGYLPLAKTQFDVWRNGCGTGLVTWSDNPEPTATVCEFQIVENFLTNKMLFVGNSDTKGENTPIRGELLKKTLVSCEYKVEDEKSQNTAWQWSTLFAFYEKYEALLVIIHTNIPEISVDQLVFLREKVWCPKSETASWQLIVEPEKKRLYSFHSLFDQVLEAGGLPTVKIDVDYPLFSLMELRTIGPAEEVMNFPVQAAQLTLGEHYGLFSGDEGYRLVNLEKTQTKPSINTGYPWSLFDTQYQFSGRKYFAYHFAATNCICFMAKDVAVQKKQWAEWHADHVANMSSVVDYIGLAASVPCLSDGIPVMIELCMIRYRTMIGLERELRRAFDKKIWQRIFARFSPQTTLDKAQRRVEQLDLYQDNALWIIGGPHTDLIFNYSAVRARLDKARQSIQMIESETIRVALAVLGALVALFALLFGTAGFLKNTRELGLWGQTTYSGSQANDSTKLVTPQATATVPISSAQPSASATNTNKR